jgi:hypothetical protein
VDTQFCNTNLFGGTVTLAVEYRASVRTPRADYVVSPALMSRVRHAGRDGHDGFPVHTTVFTNAKRRRAGRRRFAQA